MCFCFFVVVFFFFTSEGKTTSSVDTSESLESCRFGQNAQLYKVCVRRGPVSVPARCGDDTNHRVEKVCSSVTGSFRVKRAKLHSRVVFEPQSREYFDRLKTSHTAPAVCLRRFMLRCMDVAESVVRHSWMCRGRNPVRNKTTAASLSRAQRD